MLLKRFIGDDRGATAIEYALVAGLVSLAMLVGLVPLSGTVQELYMSAVDAFPD